MDSDVQEIVEKAELCYVNTDQPGYTRKPWGRGFTYQDKHGSTIKDEHIRERLDVLAIPPAWTDVWISPDENGHIQATGRDEKNRKQYIYHTRWQQLRNQHKFDNMLAFGDVLPQLRETTEQHLRKRDITREKVLATVIRLLDSTLIRIGNREYARMNDSYGLVTMRDRHVEIEGSTIKFEFTGKRGIEHTVDLQDRRLAKIVKACQEIPGHHLFQYYDEDGNRQPLGSTDVNQYIFDITGHKFTSKDFRTWGGSRLAVATLLDEDAAEITKTTILDTVSQGLGNTKAVCRQYYIHPAIFSALEDGTFTDVLKGVRADRSEYGLDKAEKGLLKIINEYS
jgi:DNA topoisomerase-1